MITPERHAELKRWLPFVTPHQRRYIEAVLEHGGPAKAARVLGVASRIVTSTLSKARRTAARNGDIPGAEGMPPTKAGYHSHNPTIHYAPDEDGVMRVKQVWDRQRLNAVSPEEIQETFRRWAEDCIPVGPLVRSNTRASCDDTFNVLPIGDPHYSMLAWGEEVGENFDIEIALKNMRTAVDQLLADAPAAKELIIINVGDAVHSDSSRNQTTKGTPVDVDGRRGKVIRALYDIEGYIVNRACETHDLVTYDIRGGNHDEETVIMFREGMRRWFSANDRVTVADYPGAFSWHERGKVLIGATHGDKTKGRRLQDVMVVDKAEAWGRTLYRHWYTGHIHHKTILDVAGVTIETLRTLAGKDAYHYNHGYRAPRTLQLDTWSRTFGRRSQHVVNIEMINALQEASK